MKMEYVEANDVVTQARRAIGVQVDALLAMQARIDGCFERAVDIVLETRGRVVVVGMGKSGIIGRKIAATLASTGTASFFVHPGEAFHGDLGMISPVDVALLISNSGETEEVIRLLPFLQHQRNRIVAMTGCSGSTLARHADVVLDVSVEREACGNNLAPTCSTTATLVMGGALAVALAAQRNFQPEDFARFHPGGSLGRRLLTRVADVMHKDNLPFCTADASFRDVVQVINRGRLGLALVMDGERLLGLITDGDVRRAFDSGLDYKALTAAAIMTRNPRTVAPEVRFALAEDEMRSQRINALVVIDGDGRVAGVLQIYDIVADEPVN